MIVKTEAIVLSAMKYRDTSKIVRLYTREFGRLSVLAKGARETKSRFRSSLEPLNHVLAVLYKKEHRELQLLSQCDVLTSFRHIAEDMDKLQAALSGVELVTLVAHEEERNEDLFDLLLSFLRAVNDATKNVKVALYYFEMKLTGLLGFQPELDMCSQCGRSIGEKEEGVYGFGPSGILCESCGANTADALSPSSVSALRALRRFSSVDAALNLHLTPSVQEQVGRLLLRHLQTHIEGFRGLRSEEVFAAIK
jgi:DNA repair protein RecO (recombination protein O)